MSCYILSKGQTITTAFAVYEGLLGEPRVHNCEAIADIALDLHFENIKSVDARYQESSPTNREYYTPDEIQKALFHWMEYRKEFLIVGSHSAFNSRLIGYYRHWIYQSCEHPNNERGDIWNKIYEATYRCTGKLGLDYGEWGYSVIPEMPNE